MLRLRCIGVSQTKDGGGEWPGVSGAKQTRAIGLDLFEARHGHGRVRSRSSTAGDGPPSRLMSGPGRRARGLVSLAWRGSQIFVVGVQSRRGRRYPDSPNGRHADPGRAGRNPREQRPSERFARLYRPPLRCVTANPGRSLRGAEGRTAARRAGNGRAAAPPRRRALTLTNPAPPRPPHTPPTAIPPAETDAAPQPPHSLSRPTPAHPSAANIRSPS